MVKKLTAILLGGAMIFGLAACGSKTDTAKSESAKSTAKVETTGTSASSSAQGEIKTVEAGKLHMATNAAFPPYEMTTDNGGFEGIDVEIATEIAKRLGLELVVDDMDFDAVLAAVQSNKADIAMAGMTVNDERKKNVDFTDSYANSVQRIIVPENSEIQKADDLANAKMIGAQQGTTGYIYCSDTPENGGFGADHVTAYPDGATAVQALMAGKVDAVVIDELPAKEYVKANKGLKLLDSEYINEDYAIGINKKNPALREAVNKVLNELKTDGTVKKITDKYIKG